VARGEEACCHKKLRGTPHATFFLRDVKSPISYPPHTPTPPRFLPIAPDWGLVGPRRLQAGEGENIAAHEKGHNSLENQERKLHDDI